MALIPELIGESAALLSLRTVVERLLRVQRRSRRLPPILLQGETGTGKGLLARALHAHGERAAQPFVNVDCAAIPSTLLEAELFGFERSAFTGAHRSKPGLFQEAHGGVLFLDEIATLSLGLQAKLLKAIDERLVRRLGSTHSESVDVWVIAAAAEPLGTAVRDGRFRADLHHRLSGLVFEMPPLRARGEDIALLAEHFLSRACADYRLPAKVLAADARAALRAHAWPGNVRELANVMERLALLWPEMTVTGAAARDAIGPAPVEGRLPVAARTTMLRESLESFERDRLVEALEAAGWNVTRAAKRLGVARNTLRYRIEKHDVRPPRPRRGRRPAAAGPTERRTTWLLRVALEGGSERPALAGAVVERVAEKVASFGGHVAAAEAGGVSGVFGLEPAEDAPARAAQAALASMRAIEQAHEAPHRFAARAAIALTSLDVDRGAGGADLAAAALRVAMPALDELIRAAEPGAIVVGASAGPFLERRFMLRRVHEGPPAPMGHGWRLLGVEPTGYELGGRLLSPFVGRRGEQDTLRAALAHATRGLGRVVGIVGDPGAGKSRLVYEFRVALGDTKAAWLEGRCVSYGLGVPYLPFISLLRNITGVTERDTPEVVTRKLHAVLDAAAVDVAGSAPYLLELLGVRRAEAPLAVRNPEALRTRTFEALRRLILGRGEPTVVVIEDLHWIDATSEALLASLVDTVARSPMLLLATYRPGYRPPWSERSYAAQLALSPLSDDDSLTVVEAIARGAALAPPARQAIVARADGNPFHLEELAWAAVAAGGAVPAVAETVHDVLLARMDALPADTRRVLQAASILGRRFSTALLAEIAGAPGDLEAHLRELKRREFLYERDGGGEPVNVFKHALTQEVAYDSVDPERRRSLHGATGRALEALYAERTETVVAELARHYARTDEHAKAADYLTRFGEQAARKYALSDAVESLTAALAHAEALPLGQERDRRVSRVIWRFAFPMMILGRLADLVTLMEARRENVERAAEPSSAAWYYFWLAYTYDHLGRRDVPIALAERALTEARRAGDATSAAGALHVLGFEAFWLGRFAEGAEYERQAVELLRDSDAQWLLGGSHWVRSLNHVLAGQFASALEAAGRTMAVGKDSEDARLQSYADGIAGLVAALRGDIRAGVEICHRGVSRAPDPLAVAATNGWLGYAYLEGGQLAEARDVLTSTVEQFRTFGLRAVEGWHASWLCEVEAREGNLEGARSLATSALRTTLEAGFPYGAGVAQRAAGRIAHMAADLEMAHARLAEALATFTRMDARYDVARTRIDLATVAHAAGHEAAAVQHISTARDIFAALGVPRWVERTETVAASLGIALDVNASGELPHSS